MANFVWHLQWTIMLLNAIFANGEDSHGIEKRAANTETKKVVCYYTNWSVYRPGTAKFSPQNINPYLCTHLIYAFGGLDRDNGLKPYDKYQDIEQGGYSKFNGLKTYNKKLKTLLAIGGWNEGSSRFSSLVASEDRRKIFVKNVAKFLRQNNFDGLDLDWEYPTFRDGSKPDDKDNYASLVQELREEFENESSKSGKPRLLLTMAVPAGIEYIDKGYDVPKLNKYLDFMNILSYDYVSVYSPNVNHHAPLHPIQEGSNDYNDDAQLNIDYTVKHYLKSGADRDKLVLGIPTYGRSFTLFNSDSTDIGSPADGPGEKGEASREKGYLTYFEICASLKSNDDWTIVHPKPGAMGPYAYRGNQWVGYDDEDIAKLKSKYVVQNELAGIMFWTIDNDDFRGKCHNRPYPLIEAAKEALFSNNGTSSKQISAALKEDKSHRHGLKRNKNKLSTSTTTTTTTTESASVNPLSTPEPPTTPDPGTDFVCQDEGFFPHPRDCRKYFWCLDSGPSGLGIVAHQFTCPSDLLFNKASDSCDYSRNVICTKKSGSTTSTTAKPKVTSATARNTLFKQTSTTSTSTTTTSTTTEAAVEEYEDVENEDSSSEEDPKAIKKLVELIKKLGGIAELEKQLKITDDSKEATTPEISRSLYDKVFNAPSVNRYQSEHPNGPSGPQHEGLSLVKGKENDRDEDEIVSNKNDKSKWKPQYVTIQRSRSTAKPDESADDSEQPVHEASSLSSPITKYLEKADDAEEKQFHKEPESSTSTQNSVKKYSAALRTRTPPSLRSTTSRYVNLERPKKPDKTNANEEESSDDRSVSPSNQRYVTHFRSKQNPAPVPKEGNNEESSAAASGTVHRPVLEEKLLSNEPDDEESGNDSALIKETTKVSDDAELNNKASVPLPVTSAPTVKYVTVSRASSKLENNDNDDSNNNNNNDDDDNNNNNNNNNNNSNNNSSISSSSSSTINSGDNFDNNVEYKQSLDGDNSFLEIGSNRRIFDRANSAGHQQQPAPTTYDVPPTLTSVVTSIFEGPVTERKRIPVRGLSDYLSRRQLVAKSSTTKQQQPQLNEGDGTETSTSAGKRRRIGALRPKEKSLAAGTEESSKNASSENNAELPTTSGGPLTRRRSYIRSSSTATPATANEQTSIYARFPKRKDRYPLVTRSTGDYFASSSPVDELTVTTEKNAGYRFSRRRSSTERTNTFSPSNRFTPTSSGGSLNATSELVMRERLFPRRRSKYNETSSPITGDTGELATIAIDGATDSSSVSRTITPKSVDVSDDGGNKESATATEHKTSSALSNEIPSNKKNYVHGNNVVTVAGDIVTTTKPNLLSNLDNSNNWATVPSDSKIEESATENFETLLLNENSNSFNTPFDVVTATRKKTTRTSTTRTSTTTTESFSTVQFPIISDAKQKPYDKIIYIKLDNSSSSDDVNSTANRTISDNGNVAVEDNITELATTNDDTTNSFPSSLSTSPLSSKTKPANTRDRKKSNSPIYRIKKLNGPNAGASNNSDATINAATTDISLETASSGKSNDNKSDDKKPKKQSDLFKRTTVTGWSKPNAKEDRTKQYGTQPATVSLVTNPVSDWLSESMKVVGDGDKNTIFEFDFKANDNKMNRLIPDKEIDSNPMLTMTTMTRFENDYDIDTKTAAAIRADTGSLKTDHPSRSTVSESNKLHSYDSTVAASSTIPPRSIRNRSKYKFKQDERIRNNVAPSSASQREDESPSSSETFSTTPSYRVRQQFRRPSSFHRTRSTSAFIASTTESTSTTGLERLYKFTRRRRPKPEYTSSTEPITELINRGRKFEVEQRSSSIRDAVPVATTSLYKSDHSRKNMLSDLDADNMVPEDGYVQTVAIQPDTLSTETVSDSDLANAAVIAIHSLRSAPPAPFSSPTTESLTPDGYKYKIRTSTVDVKTPVAFSRQSITHHRRGSSRPLRTTTMKPYNPITRDIYSDYRDSEMELRAEPVDIPITGKVRIHADGYIECLDMGNFPHPFSCKKFISCAKMKSDNLLGWEYTCPRGLSFDPIGGICNWEAGLGCKE